MFGTNTGRQSGVFRGESQNDPSRSNSLMSENSSQSEMHPFYKVIVYPLSRIDAYNN